MGAQDTIPACNISRERRVGGVNLSNFPYPVVQPTFTMRLNDMAPLDPAKVKYCVWHHVGAVKDDDGTATGTNTYHINTKGWAGIGYHGQIRWNGNLELGRPLTKQGVHTADHNGISIGFCLAGNFSIGDIMDRPHQYMSAVALARAVSLAFPGIQHVRHGDLRPTACPGTKFPWQKFTEDIAMGTPIIGKTQTTVAQMQAWAIKRGAHQRFIDIAPTYHKYGLLTGIRAEVLYCQSAKETAFGKFTGAVTPDMNNWAGIKIGSPIGDRREDHESFPTPDDGVRAHFNHIAAYVGIATVGVPHARYHVVKKLSWAGSIRYVEELGGKYAPNPDYGKSIVRDYMTGLLAVPTPVIDEATELRRLLEQERAHNAKLRSMLNRVFLLFDQGAKLTKEVK